MQTSISFVALKSLLKNMISEYFYSLTKLKSSKLVLTLTTIGTYE